MGESRSADRMDWKTLDFLGKMETQQRIAVGTEVSWQSQAAGSYIKKTGIVEAFVPQQADVRVVWKELYPETPFRYGAISQSTSSIPRYLVKVIPKGKNGTDLNPKYYCPGAGVIEKQNLDAARE